MSIADYVTIPDLIEVPAVLGMVWAGGKLVAGGLRGTGMLVIVGSGLMLAGMALGDSGGAEGVGWVWAGEVRKRWLFTISHALLGAAVIRLMMLMERNRRRRYMV